MSSDRVKKYQQILKASRVSYILEYLIIIIFLCSSRVYLKESTVKIVRNFIHSACDKPQQYFWPKHVLS